LLATSALPAVAELSAANDRDQLWRASRAVGIALLIVSGGLGLAVVSVNGAFVPWWVGPEQYAGPLVTLLAVLAMVLRHGCFSFNQIMYALGAERLLTVVAAADGVVTVIATIGWIWAFGIIGVPLGSLTGVVLIHAPAVVLWLGRAAGVGPISVLGWVAPWAMRFAVVLGFVAVASFLESSSELIVAAGLLIGQPFCKVAAVESK
jgi:O-antigen/teichoic acid export membrane protein